MNAAWEQLTNATLTAAQGAMLNRFLDLLLDQNQRMNLTRLSDRAQAEIGHVADALTLLRFLPKEAHRLADVGSGGGVPGIPLAIARPDVQVTLIESTQKKAAFLKRAAEALNLTNVQVIADRAEKLPHEQFDVVVARALAAMEQLAAWCLPLARHGGKVLAMKGPRIVDELPAARKTIQKLGGGEAVVHPVRLAGLENHVIVEIVKA